MQEPKFKRGDILYAFVTNHLVLDVVRYDNDMGQYLYALLDDTGLTWFGWEKCFIKVGERNLEER